MEIDGDFASAARPGSLSCEARAIVAKFSALGMCMHLAIVDLHSRPGMCAARGADWHIIVQIQ